MDIEGRLALLTAMQLNNNNNSSKLKYIDLSENCQNPATYIPVPINRNKKASQAGTSQCDSSQKRGGQSQHGRPRSHNHSDHETDDVDDDRRLAEESLLAQTLTISTQLQLSREHLQILF